MKRILLVLALLLSGLAYGQNTTKKIETICGYKFTEIQDLLKGAGSEFSYKSSEITKQLNAGFFDNIGVVPPELTDARKMCVLLYELTGLENKDSDATTVANAIVDRYGPYKNKTIAKCKTDLLAAIKSGKALQIINNFYLSTGRIWTTKLPEYYKTYEPTVYAEEYNSAMTAADARAKLATQIDSFITTYPTQEKIVEVIKTVDNTITQEQIDAEGEHLYNTKNKNLKDFSGKIKNKQSCAEINSLSAYLEGVTVNGSTLVLGVAPIDGTISPVKKANTSDYANGVYSQKAYSLAGKDMDAVAKEIAASNPTMFKGITTWKALTEKVASLVAACGKTKTKSSGSNSDLDAIIKAGNAGTGTWFQNWNLCNSILNTETTTKKDICKQLILEASYSDANAAAYGLTDNTGAMINMIEGGSTPINQLEFYLDAVVVVKKAGTDFKQEEIDLTASNPNKETTDSKPLWSDLEAKRTNVADAEASVERMKNYLLNDFYKDDAAKNLCFGFPINTAASTTGTNNVISNIKDLTVSLDVDKTIAFYTSHNVVNANMGKTRTIQQLCVIFNRVKKANVTGLENYMAFAEKLVKLFGLDEGKISLMAVSGNGVEKPLDTFKKGLSFALVSNDDKEIIHWLSFLNGFGDVYDDAYYADRTAKIEDSNKEYSIYDAITDIIIASSGAGSTVSTVSTDSSFDINKIVTDNKTVTENKIVPENKIVTDDKTVTGNVSDEMKTLIADILDVKCEHQALNDKFDALMALITKDLSMDNYELSIQELLKKMIKAYDPAFWTADLDTYLDKIIALAFSTPFKGVDSLDKDILTAILSASDADVLKAIKTRLSTTDASTKLYTSAELIMLAKARLMFESGKYVQTNSGNDVNTKKPLRTLKPRDNASISSGTKPLRTLKKKSEVKKTTTSKTSSSTMVGTRRNDVQNNRTVSNGSTSSTVTKPTISRVKR